MLLLAYTVCECQDQESEPTPCLPCRLEGDAMSAPWDIGEACIHRCDPGAVRSLTLEAAIAQARKRCAWSCVIAPAIQKAYVGTLKTHTAKFSAPGVSTARRSAWHCPVLRESTVAGRVESAETPPTIEATMAPQPTTAQIQRDLASRRRAHQQASSAAGTGRPGRRTAAKVDVSDFRDERGQFKRGLGVAAERRRLLVQMAAAEQRRHGQAVQPAVQGAEFRPFPASVRLTHGARLGHRSMRNGT